MTENNRAPNRVIGHFGHGVVGREIFDEEQAVVALGADVFGPGVTGVGLVNQPVNRPGPGVTGEGKVPPASGPPVPSLSVRALEDALQASPLLVDTFLPVELERPGGPRKGALEAFEIAERSRNGGAREEVLAQIAAVLDTGSAPGPGAAGGGPEPDEE